MPLSAEDIERRRKLRDDFQHYAPRALRIRTKRGTVEAFTPNRAQLYVHDRLEAQRNGRGYVRALVLKGRQMGMSTYIGGRIYWRTTHGKGLRSFILTHMDDATNNLFGMAKRFYENSPPVMQPALGHSNAKELTFSGLDSSYKVGTAGNKGVGRSETLQLFHGSECAYWPHADEHFKGIMQAIALEPGTEAILESTANGLANVYGKQWALAERGDSEFEPIFVPWFWDEGYTREPAADWQPLPDWQEYGELHKLSPQQLYWAFLKNRELISSEGGGMGGDVDKPSPGFKQEYPGTAAEAFESSGEGAFINPLKVMKARKNFVDGYGPVILGVDPNRGGRDKCGIIDRQGRRVGAHVCERVNFGDDLMRIAGHVIDLRKRLKQRCDLRKIVVDITGIGAGVYDRLKEQIPASEILGINFASAALNKQKYANRRAEMHDRKREWYNDEAGVQIPDRDDFAAEETVYMWGPGATHFRSNGQLILEDKEHVRERLGYSPDWSDAHALTHAIDMRALYQDDDRGSKKSGSGWAG